MERSIGGFVRAVIGSLIKRDLMSNPVAAPVSFLLLANPMRPNGGILARGFEGMTIPLIGITFHGPTPTGSGCDGAGTGDCLRTVDVAQQYDLLGGDAPADLLNVLAWANSLAAYYYLHGEVPNVPLTDDSVIDQQAYGDTQYYLIAAERLPLLMPLQQLGVPDPILAVVDAPLRVLVEASYVRNVSPGQHVKFRLLPSTDPITLGVNFFRAIPVGIDDGLQQAGLGRALGTTPLDHPYGVGGDDQGGVFGGTPLTGDDPPAGLIQARAQTTPAPTGGQRAAELSIDDSQQLTGTQQTDGADPVTQPTDLGTGTPDAEETPEFVRPHPLRQLIRGPFEFDRPKPSADRPSGNRPLQRIVRGLTVPRPSPRIGENEARGDETGDRAGGNNNRAAGGNEAA